MQLTGVLSVFKQSSVLCHIMAAAPVLPNLLPSLGKDDPSVLNNIVKLPTIHKIIDVFNLCLLFHTIHYDLQIVQGTDFSMEKRHFFRGAEVMLRNV